ncbi:MAG: hypothetical protein JWR19_2402 [Pedosphaera sp.]|nr:hypothetical protein [Pedosphaera sp.]
MGEKLVAATKATPPARKGVIVGISLLAGICCGALVLYSISVLRSKHTDTATTKLATPATNINILAPSNPPVAATAVKLPKDLSDLKVGDIQLEKTKGSSLVYAVGTLKNESEYQRFGIRIKLDLLNGEGVKLGTAQDYMEVLEPHGSWRFRAMVTDSKAVSAKLDTLKEE